MKHEERIELAGRLRDLILERYADSVLAVFVTSSTARGLDLEFSDLELTAVHRDGAAPPDRSYYYRGILIEVSHVEESKILALRMEARWAETAGGYRGRIVLYEHDRWTERLDQVLDALDATDRVPAQRSALLDLLEFRDKLRNARPTGDEIFLRACAFYFADSAANFVLFLNGQQMTTTRWFFRQAIECPDQPPGFREHLEVLLGVRRADPGEISAAAEALSEGLITMAAARGIIAESEALLV
ncbi:MAG: kanamycin nucleotidyltransferase C-terminal domain-containing protein [bacterium]